MRKIITIGLFAALVLVAVTSVFAYDAYRMFGADASCANCHPGFVSKGPLHDLHVGNQQMTNSCLRCHAGPGDIPKTWTGGSGESCRGCHGRDNGPGFTWAAGLRLHHANAGAPADINGQFCVDCHADDPAPDPESTAPPSYGQPDVNITDPCVSSGEGGEDFDGDGFGLDNDGDLAYDENDTDCNASGIGDTPALALGLKVFPNPAGPGGARVSFDLPSATDVDVSIYDVRGRLVESQSYAALPSGVNDHMFRAMDNNGRPLPAGVYVVRVTAGETTAFTKMVLVK